MAGVPLEISVAEAQLLIAAQGAQLRVIDVRDPDEYALCRLPGAELMPLPVLPSQAAQKLADQSAPLLLYCHHGMRSARAAALLRELGYAGAISLAGGIEQWAVEVDPTMARY